MAALRVGSGRRCSGGDRLLIGCRDGRDNSCRLSGTGVENAVALDIVFYVDCTIEEMMNVWKGLVVWFVK